MKLLAYGNNTKTTYTYNEWNTQGGRLNKIESGTTASFPSSPNLQKLTYAYDAVGNITQITDGLNTGLVAGVSTAQKQCFVYDGINRLTSAVTRSDCTGSTDVGTGSYSESYDYDAATGNLSNKAGVSYGYDSAHPHAVKTLNGTDKYSYDANGNMTSRVVGSVTYTLNYDEENRLSSIQYVENGTTKTIRYYYNGDGKQVLVKQANNDKTLYVGSLFEIAYVGTAPAAWKTYYIAGSARIAMRTSAGLSWLYADQLGSTTRIVNPNGTNTALLYKAWGERRDVNASSTDYRYTGQREAEAGLYFYQARWYDPALGRFAQADTIIPEPGRSMSWDKFAYVNNNPVNFNDPSGHYVCSGYDSSWGEASCYDIINNWLHLLTTNGGDLGNEIVRQFWQTDQEWAVSITFGDTLNGAWGFTDTRFGKNINISLGNYGSGTSSFDQRINASKFGHEIYHLAFQKHPQIMSSAYGEKQAYDVTWQLMSNFGLEPERIAAEFFRRIHKADYSEEGLATVQAILGTPETPAREGEPIVPYILKRAKGGIYTVTNALTINLQALFYIATGCFGPACGINWNPSTNGWEQRP